MAKRGHGSSAKPFEMDRFAHAETPAVGHCIRLMRPPWPHLVKNRARALFVLTRSAWNLMEVGSPPVSMNSPSVGGIVTARMDLSMMKVLAIDCALPLHSSWWRGVFSKDKLKSVVSRDRRLVGTGTYSES